MTHGHEQWCGDCLRECRALGGGGHKEESRDDCNSVTNKI